MEKVTKALGQVHPHQGHLEALARIHLQVLGHCMHPLAVTVIVKG